MSYVLCVHTFVLCVPMSYELQCLIWTYVLCVSLLCMYIYVLCPVCTYLCPMCTYILYAPLSFVLCVRMCTFILCVLCLIRTYVLCVPISYLHLSFVCQIVFNIYRFSTLVPSASSQIFSFKHISVRVNLIYSWASKDSEKSSTNILPRIFVF